VHCPVTVTGLLGKKALISGNMMFTLLVTLTKTVVKVPDVLSVTVTVNVLP